MSAARARRILFTVMPYEGEVRDRVTAKFYKNSAVKYMPLGVLSIGACIPEPYEFAVLDAASRNLTLDETIAEIEAFAPDVLGLSVVTYRAWAMIQILERTSAPIKVVGGPHTKYNHEAIRRQGAHAVFVDDAEVTFPQWLADGCPEGTFFGGSVELDSLPLPARNLLDLDDYRIEYNDDLLFRVGNLRLPMYSSKGCPFACIYCDVQQKTFNFKNPEKCVAEFQDLLDLGATSIHVLDDAFNIRKDRVEGICRALVENGIDVDWSARGTVEVRESVVAELSAAGCKRLHVGIESLDDETLIYFKKSSRFKHIQRFAELCNKYGITILDPKAERAAKHWDGIFYRYPLTNRLNKVQTNIENLICRMTNPMNAAVLEELGPEFGAFKQAYAERRRQLADAQHGYFVRVLDMIDADVSDEDLKASADEFFGPLRTSCTFPVTKRSTTPSSAAWRRPARP